MATKSGFGAKKAATKEIDLAVYNSAPSIEEFKVDKLFFEDYDVSKGESPELPVGIFYQQNESDPAKRLRKLKINPKIGTGYYERELEKRETAAKSDLSKHVAKASWFLSLAIEAIDDIPFADLAGAKSVSPKDLCQRWYMGDVVSAIFAIRDVVQGKRDYASVTLCGCEKKRRVFDSPEQGRPLHSIDMLEYTYLKELNQEPIYRIDLQDGFHDGMKDIKRLFVRPMRLFDNVTIANPKNNAADTIKMLKQLVVGIPDSEAFGQVRGSVFGDHIWDQMTLRDRNQLTASVNKLQVGPETKFEVECHNCYAATTSEDNINWLVQTRYTVYSSGMAMINE